MKIYQQKQKETNKHCTYVGMGLEQIREAMEDIRDKEEGEKIEQT